MPQAKLGHTVTIEPAAGEPERFAAEELALYLARMLERRVRVATASRPGAGAIHVRARRRRPLVRVPVRAEDETFTIDARHDRIVLTGGSPRATLFAAYSFLEELGCRFFAPDLAAYKGIGHEHVPKISSLRPELGRRTTTPSMLHREWLIEECRTQSIPALKAILAWFAKRRINILHAPIDYQHSGRFTWDSIRDAIVPEARRRGLILEVGGHGYENFLHPDDFFDEHPEWFGMVGGRRSRNPHVVFETADPQALRTFARRVADYLQAHDEIDILSLIPPDRVTWGKSAASVKQGSPSRRQGIVTNAVVRELRRRRMPQAVQIFTYDRCEDYPERLTVDAQVITSVDLFYQKHTAPIFDPTAVFEHSSLSALDQWLEKHQGPLCYFFYHRRYFWQSRPHILPTLLWADLQYLEKRGVVGVCAGFVEPGDWISFEVQHLLMACLSADTATDPRQILLDYCCTRFGAAAELMNRFFWMMEKLTIAMMHAHHAQPPTADQVALAGRLHADCKRLLGGALRKSKLRAGQREHLRRLQTALGAIGLTLQLYEAQLVHSRPQLEAVIERYRRYARRHRDKGLFVEPFWLSHTTFDMIFTKPIVSKREAQRIEDRVSAEF